MHVAQRPRQSTPPSAATGGVARREPAPAAPVAPSLQRAVDPAVERGDRLGGLLAGAVQRRAAGGPVLQRAIIAIDGPTDKAPAKKITRNCLANLSQSGGRGTVSGPRAVDRIKPPKLAQNESLYILGHGNTAVVADLTPAAMGNRILRWYGNRPYRGKIKLVACSSGIAPSLGAQSYAERLSVHLTNNATAKFHPASVDGVLGVAWVDEQQDKIIAIDDNAYDQAEQGGHDVEGAFATDDPVARHQALTTIFGKPGEGSVQTGKPAKVRFLTNLPDLPPPTPWSFWRALGKLVPCIP